MKTEEEIGPSENTLVELINAAVCNYLNENTDASNWSAQVKESVGVGLHQVISQELVEVIETLASLEPIIIAILQGPLGTKLYNTYRPSKISQVAFEIMNESMKLIKQKKVE